MTAAGLIVVSLVVAAAIVLPIVVFNRRRSTSRKDYSRRSHLLSGALQMIAAVIFLITLIGESGWTFYLYLVIAVVFLVNGAFVIRGVIRRDRTGEEIKWHGY